MEAWQEFDKETRVPLMIDGDMTKVYEPAQAKFVLVGAAEIDNRCSCEKCEANNNYVTSNSRYTVYNNELVWVNILKLDGWEFMYVRLSDVNRSMPKMAAYVGGLLTGNLKGLLSMGHCNWYDSIRDKGEKGRLSARKFMYNYNVEEKERERISQSHHYHVRLQDLMHSKTKALLTGDEAILAMHLDRYNRVESTHVTFLTYYRSLDDAGKNMFFGMVLEYNGIDNEWLKFEGRCAKQSGQSFGIDMLPFYELNVLVNRLDTPVDWDAEEQNRTWPQLAEVPAASVYKHAATLFTLAKAEGKKPVAMAWDEYNMQRAVSMPAGAVHSSYDEDNVIIKSLPREVRNKKGFAAATSATRQDYWLNREPAIHAYTSTKYEWGKARALYGCDVTSHVNSDYGLMACEETFPFFVPTGSAANAQYIRNVMAPFKKQIAFCYDYDDFNSQHSSVNMQQAIRAWRDVYSDSLTSEQLKAIDWTIDSIDNMHVHDKLHDNEYVAQGTLFSGWRLTSFINTTLNYCYLAEAKINELSNLHMHNGDDVFATVDNVQQAIDIYANAKAMGVRANMTKMSIGTIAEFLRVDMRAQGKENGAQYLTRGIATFVHSRIESDAPMTYRNLVEAYKTRYEEVLNRGAVDKEIRRLYRKQLFFARRTFDVLKEDEERLLEYHTLCGGLNSDGKITCHEIKEVLMELADEVSAEISRLIRPGVVDYVTYMAQKFPQFRDELTMRSVETSIIRAFGIARKTIQVVPADITEKWHMRAMQGAWSEMEGIAIINRVRMGVSNIIVVMSAIASSKAIQLNNVKSPIEWLALLVKRK